MTRLIPESQVIIAVEDSSMRLRLMKLVGECGFDALTAVSRRELWKSLRSRRPCLLLIDWDPASGAEGDLCSEARRQFDPHELFVLALSNEPAKADTLLRLPETADDLIRASADDGELRARLLAGLKVLSLQRELHAARQAAAANLIDLAARADEVAATRDVAVFALAKLAESRDPETGEHLERLRSYSQILAEQLQVSGPYCDMIDEVFLEDLYRSSPLHDIGKVGIPDAILRKPGRLTPDEFEIMKQHTTIGAEALESAMHRSGGGGFLRMAVDIARHHHERFDGAGYPCGLRRDDIPLAARIVALADVYDALTSVRVYKDAIAPEVARNMILEQEGKHFDPAVIEAFEIRFPQFVQVRQASNAFGSAVPGEMVPMAG